MPSDLWIHWNFDPPLVAALALSAVCTVALARKEARGPAFAGIAVLAVAFVSPLCALSSALFSARTVHHVLLVAVAAPFFAAALPRARSFARPSAPPTARWPDKLPLPLVLSTAILWLWHVPSAYTAALNHDLLYWAMQLSLLGSATWLWSAIFTSRSTPAAMVTLVAAAAQMGLLGAILTFAPVSLYPHHAIAPFAFGLDPLQDQQLGGLIMWVPAMLPYAVGGGLIIRRNWNIGPMRRAA